MVSHNLGDTFHGTSLRSHVSPLVSKNLYLSIVGSR